MNEPIKIRLSSTALSYSACSLRFMRHVVDGYKEPAMSCNIVYGIAVHKFIDTMSKTGNISEAVVAAKRAFSLPKVDSSKQSHLSDERHMITTCLNLWSGFIQDDNFEVLSIDGKPTTETTIELSDFYKDDFISVDLCGTMDKLGQFNGGCYAIGDWKITSTWTSKGYFKQYELSRALRFYRLALYLESLSNPDSTLGRLGKQRVGAFIDAVFIKPDPNDNEVLRSDVFQYSEVELIKFKNGLTRWCMGLSDKIRDRVHLEKEGVLNGSCQGKWGLCPFWNVCVSPDTAVQQLLDRDFLKVKFDPLNYNDL